MNSLFNEEIVKMSIDPSLNDDINMSLIQNENQLKTQISNELSIVFNENKIKDNNIEKVENSFKKFGFPCAVFTAVRKNSNFRIKYLREF